MINKRIPTNFSFALITIVVILLTGLTWYMWKELAVRSNFTIPKINIPKKNKSIACTQEAKICPDGSSVGRTTPDCNFAPCPEIVGIAGKIIVTSLKPDDVVLSPVSISGKAIGSWFSKASFPIGIHDSNGKLLGYSTAQFVPKSDTDTWMTENFVDFKGEIKFNASKTESGYILFKKDNPSGQLENDESFKLPVKFNQNAKENAEVNDSSLLTWKAYKNKNFRFGLNFPDSWKGYKATDNNQSNGRGVCFSFPSGHSPFCIMNIRVMTENEWNIITDKSALIKLSQEDAKVYACDGCCGQQNYTGGGQFDEFQQARCNETGDILKTFKLIENKTSLPQN